MVFTQVRADHKYLPQVRDFRRAQLQQEEQQWRQEFQRRQETLPSLTLLQLVSLAPASA